MGENTKYTLEEIKVYCSIRFYIDQAEAIKNFQSMLSVMSMLKSKLNLSCDQIEYTLYDPDSDRDFSYYYHKTEFWDGKGVVLAEIPEQTIIYGKTGIFEAPIICYGDNHSPDQFYGNSRIQIWYPVPDSPMKIEIDYKINKDTKVNINLYREIIEQINKLGFHINNSYMHVYRIKRENLCFEGGSTGLVTFQMQDILDHFNKHRREGYLNHIMDIYYINSVLNKYIKDESIEYIRTLLGADNVSIIDDSIVFSLQQTEYDFWGYRLRYWMIIRNLRELLTHDGVL